MSPIAAADGLLAWACAQLGLDAPTCSLQPLPGDASFRRYIRLLATAPARSWMLCVAPPAQEKNREFVQVRRLLQDAGVRVPALHAADLERGWLLLEDLGDALLLPALSPSGVDALYSQAMAMLLALARVPVPATVETAAAESVRGGDVGGDVAGSAVRGGPDGAKAPLAADARTRLLYADATMLPAYDCKLLQQELDLYPQWFERGLLGLPAEPHWQQHYADLCNLLIESAEAQPQVLVHRDFHSRNLMFAPGGELVTIDFQDAVRGPLCYDLVSLLKDCYIRWPEKSVRDWALGYREQLLAQGLPGGPDAATFLRWFDLIGLQRHLKVLGIFARLHLRDGKSAYLGDLPRVLAYVQAVLPRYAAEPAIAALAQRLEQQLMPLIRQQPWWTVR